VYGFSGNDTFYMGSYSDIVYGNAGRDYLSGGLGDDTLIGGYGNDSLDGGVGNDRLDGYGDRKKEYDTLTGGAGSDTFVLGNRSSVFYYDGLGYATITDWDASSDYIEAIGSVGRYNLRFENIIGTSALDTAIYLGNSSDLVAVVQDSTDVDYSRFVIV
jgi:Ca2+-binding RTX toxin-like protein